MLNQNTFKELLPSAFQSELNESLAAIVTALDEYLGKFRKGTLLQAAEAHRLGTADQLCKKMLESCGFGCASLQKEELFQLSESRFELLASTDSMEGVGRLLDIYFPGASIQKGRPFSRIRLMRQESLRLSDRRELRQIVCVRLNKVPEENRLQEFLASCKVVAHYSTEIEVQYPQTPTEKKKEIWKLDEPTLYGRLACRTLAS